MKKITHVLSWRNSILRFAVFALTKNCPSVNWSMYIVTTVSQGLTCGAYAYSNWDKFTLVQNFVLMISVGCRLV